MLVAVLAGCAVRQCRWSYRVTRVVDGDTIVVTDPLGLATWIRLRSVDAPERGEPGWAKATRALEAKLLDREVLLDIAARDRYGRLVADVELAE